jgi:hypothetical protein
MTKWKSLLPWAAPVWLGVNLIMVMLIRAATYDWPCGPPSKETCDLAQSHPVYFVYICASAIGMLALIAATAVLAIRRDLTRWGWIGFGVSVVLALGVAGLTFGT